MKRVEHRDGKVFTVPGVLSAEECAALIAWSEAQGYAFAPVTTGAGMIPMPSVRNNNRVMVDDPERAAWLWGRLAEAMPATPGLEWAGLNERLRFYRYTPGQYFRRHLDGAFRRSARELSVLTLMVWLNDDFEGGETAFGDLTLTPRQGDALAFVHRQLHEGVEVREGTKYVLRTDVMARV